MAKNLSSSKTKEIVQLRAKNLRNGSKSLYLDLYRNGKREYEFLKMYIIPEISAHERRLNKATLEAANAIRARRTLEILNGEAGLSTSKLHKIYLLDWLETYRENQKKRGKKNESHVMTVIKVLKEYAGDDVTLDQVDRKFCEGYLKFLREEYQPKRRRAGRIMQNTGNCYYSAFSSALQAAVRADLISVNPFTKICSSDKFPRRDTKREFLTIEEIRILIATPMSHPNIKCAYLFSCFCGLRISDIKALKWKNVVCDRGQYSIEIVMQKTKEPIYLPLSSEALRWIPERGNKSASDNVFDLPTGMRVNLHLKNWTKAAGINKYLTFHSARHTFATMMLTLGADLYTTSKLLGHTNIKTTQIYAKVIDKKKIDTVNLVEGLF